MNLIQCLAHTSRRVTKEEMQLVKEHVEFLAIKETRRSHSVSDALALVGKESARPFERAAGGQVSRA